MYVHTYDRGGRTPGISWAKTLQVLFYLKYSRHNEMNRYTIIEDIIPIYTVICDTLGPLIGTIVSGGE